MTILTILALGLGGFMTGFTVHWFFSLYDGPWVKYPKGSGWSGDE